MRYRLMASYLGASYQAAVGPSDRDVTLFAAPPPPEEHGFSPVPGGGIWRKQVRLDDLDGLWESRPIGSYHGEPCLVLDDLGDRLHIVYLGMDEQRAAQLGYWEVDRGVFEVVVPRHDVTDLAEERHEFPIALLLSALPRALGAGDPGAGHGFGQNGTVMASGGVGPGGMTGWNGPAAAPQPARGQLTGGGQAQLPRAQLPPAQSQQAPPQQAQSQQAQLPPGQLPAARPQPQAMGGQQFPLAGQYQLPDGPERGAGLPGAPGPAAPAGQLRAQGAAPLGEAAQQGSAQQQPPGQPAPGSQQFPGMAAGLAQSGAPGVQGTLPPGMGQALPPAGPQPMPGRPQLPMAQQAPGPQPPLGTQPSAGMHPSLGAQQSPGTQQSPGKLQSPGAQQQFAQQFPSPPLATPQGPGTGQGAGGQQTVSSQSQSPQPQPQLPQAASEPPAPAAVAAWHGSPAPDGNGTWYFQPGPDPQQGGAVVGGYPVNGVPQNGYAQPDQGTVQAGAPGGLAGMQQYAQPTPQS